MKLFLDTADIDEIKAADKTGLIDGITTNPTLIKQNGGEPTDIYRQIADLGFTDISMEVMGDFDHMLSEGKLNK